MPNLDRAKELLTQWGTPPNVRDKALQVLTPKPSALQVAGLESLVELLFERKNVVLYGPPGSGKTRDAFRLKRAWEEVNGTKSVFVATFHPSYGYEDFVLGYRPLATSPGQFELKPGILLEACSKARHLLQTGGEDPGKVLMIIDEVNRGDVARIFGELITYIEPDKRGEKFPVAQAPQAEYDIPPNLYFLGTMNTADKSVSLLDVALRRRFAFVEYSPDPTVFATNPAWTAFVGDIDLGRLLSGLNGRLVDVGIEPDRAVGHALLAIPADATDPAGALRKKLRYDIYPLVEEYCYMDRSRIRRVLGDLVTSAGRFNDKMDDVAFRSAVAAICATDVAGSGEGVSPTTSAGAQDAK